MLIQSSPMTYTLHYEHEAKDWNEALPIGNGRIGAMVFGGVIEERYQINEDTFWSGFPRDTNNYEAIRYLKQARALITNEQYGEAQALIESKMLSVNCQAYQPFIDLWIRLHKRQQPTHHYERNLQLNDAIVSSKAAFEHMTIKKEAWVSAPNQVLVIHIESTTPLHLELELTSAHPYKVLEHQFLSVTLNAPTHIADNYLNDHPQPVQYEDNKGIKANCVIQTHSDGHILYKQNRIEVKKATQITFYVAIQTSYTTFDEQPHQNEALLLSKNMDTLSQLGEKDYCELKRSHLADYQSLFNRVSFSLSDEGDKQSYQATDKLLAQYKQSPQQLELEELYFHYARYLLISSSRQGSQATNLQGIWNEHVQPPWFSDYTLNINTEMNYWATEALSLTECAEPLVRFIKELAVNGARTAKIHYNARGWTAHHNSDLWRMSSPTAGSASWAFWPMSGIWLCQHLWEHYLYHLDLQFLKDEAFPIMKGAALFALDWLVEDEEGKLVTNPSTSPENMFIHLHTKSAVATGSTMDLTLIRELFEHCIEAAARLHIEDEDMKTIKLSLAKLAPPLLTRDGLVSEWLTTFTEAEPGHRHVSHLYGVYPGTTFLEEKNKTFKQAALRSLQARIEHGGGHTGWSCAWLINLFARLEEGELAYKYVKQLLSLSTYNNLLDAHPPFQIDGNFGGAAGMLEMLVQSHLGKLSLLPALPQAWKTGYITGISVRGGFILDLFWKNRQLDFAMARSNKGGMLRLNNASSYKVEEVESKTMLSTDNGVIRTKQQFHYRITLKQEDEN